MMDKLQREFIENLLVNAKKVQNNIDDLKEIRGCVDRIEKNKAYLKLARSKNDRRYVQRLKKAIKIGEENDWEKVLEISDRIINRLGEITEKAENIMLQRFTSCEIETMFTYVRLSDLMDEQKTDVWAILEMAKFKIEENNSIQLPK